MRKIIASFLIICLIFNTFNLKSEAIASDTLEIGEYVNLGNYNSQVIKWRVIHKEDINGDGKSEYMLLSDKTLSIKNLDGAESGTFSQLSNVAAISDDREKFGSNNWEFSNIREWLNSEKEVNWTGAIPSSESFWDSKNGYENELGFLNGFTEAEKRLIQPVMHKTLITKFDGEELEKDGGTADHTINLGTIDLAISNYDDSIYKNIKDKVFLLSLKEAHDYIYSESKLGAEYLAAYPTTEAVNNSEYKDALINESVKWNTWTRTPRTDTSNSFRYIDINGNVKDSSTSGLNGVRPAIYISSNINKLSGDGTEGSPFNLNNNDTLINKTEEVKVGEYFEIGRYNDENIKWKVINKDEVGLMLISDKVISFNMFDAKGDGAGNRTLYGSNNYKESNLFNWLNSSWDRANYKGKNAPTADRSKTGKNGYDKKSGFLRFFTEEEKNILKEVKVKSVLAAEELGNFLGGKEAFNYNGTVSDITLSTNYNSAKYEILKSKVNLPSLYEAQKYLPEVNSELGKATKRARANSNTNLTEASAYWLRTPVTNDAGGVVNISSAGKIDDAKAFDDEVGVRPIIYLDYGVKILGEGTELDPYYVQTNKIGAYYKLGNYNTQDILWRNINVDGDSLMLVSDKIISIKPFDANGELSENNERKISGSNNWENSNIRRWLNSKDDPVNYIYGNSPTDSNVYNGLNNYEAEKGFLASFSDREANIIFNKEYKSILPSVEKSQKDGGNQIYIKDPRIGNLNKNYSDAYFKYLTDKVRLLSTKEVYNYIYKNRSILGYDYYMAKPTADAITKSEFTTGILESSYWHYWLRTPNAFNSNEVRVMGVNKYNNNETDAYRGTRGVRPVINIDKSINFKGDGSILNPFTLVANKVSEVKIGEHIMLNNEKLYILESLNDGKAQLKLLEDNSITEISPNLLVEGLGTSDNPYRVTQYAIPTFEIESPENDTTVIGNLAVTLSVDYNLSGKQLYVKASVNGGSDVTVNKSSVISTGYKVKLSSAELNEISIPNIGANKVKIWIEDEDGNQSSKREITVNKINENLAISNVKVEVKEGVIKIIPVLSNHSYVADKGYKYEYRINSGELTTVDWSRDNELRILDNKYNAIYDIYYKVYIKDNFDRVVSRESSGTLSYTMKAANPEKIDVNVFDGSVIVNISNNTLNDSLPQHKVIVLDEDDSEVFTSAFDTSVKVYINSLENAKLYKIKTITKTTVGSQAENDEILWLENFIMTSENNPPTISEYKINYGDKVTSDRNVAVGLIATDNVTETKNLKVMFYIKTYETAGSGYRQIGRTDFWGYDADEGTWKKNHIGDYQRYYAGLDLGSEYGKKIIYVKVLDESQNFSEEDSEIVYKSKEKYIPIIDTGDGNNQVDNGYSKDNSGKYKESEGYYLSYENSVKFDVNIKNSVAVSYSYDGIEWSPWEAVEEGDLKASITLLGTDGLKTIFVKTKNDEGLESDITMMYYMVDKTAPKVDIKTLSSTYIADSGKIDLILMMEDTVSKDLYYELFIEDAKGAIVNTSIGSKYTSTSKGNTKIEKNVSGLPKGNLTVNLIVKDELGNKSMKRLSIWSK
ncbi:MAG: DUF6273 domain-containing protein [Clostridia bacterium]|jgi:hypothetical protein|nr:DUF6273 domain-containing protein [Clostridia bacterium]